ncbi:hypothetical protein ON010_g6972 [Phytophthora cinnamomi]|nr:hypothetical protein ON010_g6972 [Phytophthora cinnamomi]
MNGHHALRLRSQWSRSRVEAASTNDPGNGFQQYSMLVVRTIAARAAWGGPRSPVAPTPPSSRGLKRPPTPSTMDEGFDTAQMKTTYLVGPIRISHGVYSLHGLAAMAFGAKGAIASGFLQLTVSSGLIATYFAILFQDLPVLLSQALGLNLDDIDSTDSATKYPSMVWFLRGRVRFAELLTGSRNYTGRRKSGTRKGVAITQTSFGWKSTLATAIAVLALAQVAIFTRYTIAKAMCATGAVGGLSLLFILPAACHLKLTVGDDDDDRGGWLLMKLFPALSIATGLIGIIGSAIVAAVQVFP